MLLKPNEKLLIDFDGVIVENFRPDGSVYYPEIGPIKPGIREFLDKCKYLNIHIEVWSARTNYIKEGYNVYGAEAINQIHIFMKKNKLHYDAILEHYKPIGSHSFSWLLDDRTVNLTDGYEYMKFFFGGK